MSIEHCYQPMAPGPCLNSLSRYHYNSVSGRCEEFQYGGCGGNRNRFINAQQCEAECMNETTTTAVAPTTPGNMLLPLSASIIYMYVCVLLPLNSIPHHIFFSLSLSILCYFLRFSAVLSGFFEISHHTFPPL